MDLLTDPYIAELRAQGTAMSEPITFRSAKWPERLAPPVDPMETTIRARAQSLLTGRELGVCPPLPIAQAMDVLRWAGIAL